MAKFLLTYTRTVKHYIEVEVEAESREEVQRLYDEGQTDNRVVDSDIVDEHDVLIFPIDPKVN